MIPLNEYIKNLNTMFYAQRIKIIPKSIIKDLSLRTVAHLIMDDGTVLTGNQCRICTNCFDLDSLESLKLGFAKLGIKIDKKFYEKTNDGLRDQFLLVLDMTQIVHRKILWHSFLDQNLIADSMKYKFIPTHKNDNLIQNTFIKDYHSNLLNYFTCK